MNRSMPGSVLAATDLTTDGVAVLRTAAALAAATGAALHVLHAFGLDMSAYPGAAGVRPTFQGRIAGARRQLEREIAGAVPAEVPVASVEVVIFTAHRAILERAEQVRAGVIVLGAHRERRCALGTTADRVIRSAACSCLVVREPLRLPLTRVVVPMDLSEPARGALEAALTWSGMLGGRAPDGAGAAELDVVHVIPRLLAAADRPVDQPDVGPRLHREVEAALAGREPRPLVREELVRGDDPAGEIVRHARDVGAELLVVATHGHGAVKRALIGSVASAVARRAATPVLLVPPSRWSGHPSAAVRERAHAGAR